MTRRLALVVSLFLVLALPPAAPASGPALGSLQGGSGVLSPDGSLRYLALGAGTHTALEAVSTKDGSVVRSADLTGSWGIPAISLDGANGGLSHAGRTLVVGTTGFGQSTSFLVLDARTLRVKGSVDLRGVFGFDALSPDARTLYLVQTLSPSDTSRYVVRAYDLGAGRLLPGRVADRTERSSVMTGYPETRTTSSDGRWVFTLYQNPGGSPFVHALDTVRGVAHCVVLPFTGDQSVLFNLRLTLHDGGRALAVHWRSGRPWLDVAVGTWRISSAGGGFPWRWVGPGIGGGLALLVAAALLVRRRLRQEVDEEPRQELGLA